MTGIGTATILGPDLCVVISDYFSIKTQLRLQGDKGLTQLTFECRNLDRYNIQIFETNFNLTYYTDRINTDNLKKDLVQTIEDRSKFITTLLLN